MGVFVVTARLLLASRLGHPHRQCLADDTAAASHLFVVVLLTASGTVLALVFTADTAIALVADDHCCTRSRLEHGVDTLIEQGRRLVVCACADGLCHPTALGEASARHSPSPRQAGMLCSRANSARGGGDWKAVGAKQILTTSASIKVSGLYVPFWMALSRRSVLHATRMTGIDGPQMERTSSIHCRRGISQSHVVTHQTTQLLTFCVTLSKLSGVSTEKAMRMMCALEYDNGRRRSYSS